MFNTPMKDENVTSIWVQRQNYEADFWVRTSSIGFNLLKAQA